MFKKFLKIFGTSAFLVFTYLFLGILSLEASTGTIDPNNQGYEYAKFDVDDSQINFGCSNCNVFVTDSALTGKIWSENYGWINLNPANEGVVNNGSGVLSGYAWGENAGWVNFNPTNGGVTIGSDGFFDGTAWSENYGWINFDCTDPDACVYTDWLPDSGGGNPGGGGGPSPNKCEDGLDNDGDGWTDYPDDLGCEDANDDSEIFSGCTSPGASNYEEQANDDDGSCVFEGCTDPIAVNYNQSASTDDGSCLYQGCTDPTAINYDQNATFPDPGSCQYDDVISTPEDILGCTDPMALNHNPDADINDGSCTYSEIPVFGCADPSANNYNPNVTVDNGTCTYGGGEEVSPGGPGGGGGGIGSFIPGESAEEKIGFLGLLIPILINFLVKPNRFLSLFAVPLRTWQLLPVWFGFKKRRKPWGVVYDSVTKQPLDPVYVRLLDSSGKEIETSITDIDGRFGFLAKPGVYEIVAKKDNYVFPSKKLNGKTTDSLYTNLYYGEEIKIEKPNQVLAKNIPMDAINFNWNEFTKAKNQKLMRFFRKRQVFLAKLSNTLFMIGFIFSIISFFIARTDLNTLILSIYVLFFVLNMLGVYPKRPGYIMQKDGTVLGFSIVRIFSATLDREIKKVVANKFGSYYALVPKGKYYVRIDKKISEDEYETVYESGTFKTSKGFIDKTWKV